jgi:hypothetical protein
VSEIDGGHDMLATGSTLAANAQLHAPLGDMLRTAAKTGDEPRRARSA